MLADGDEVRAFERKFATTCYVDHGVATSNGTTALQTALHTCGIGEGDTVVTTPFSFVATANAVRFCGAEPVFADIDPETYDAALIEDAAQAHGARYDDDPVGSFGDAATFSFYPTKNMTTREGGSIVTDDEAVADRAARFVNHGRGDQYEHVELGHNFRMTNIAAAIGRV